MITIDRMRQAVAESIATKHRILEDSALMRRLEEASELVAASLRQGGKIHGSAGPGESHRREKADRHRAGPGFSFLRRRL